MLAPVRVHRDDDLKHPVKRRRAHGINHLHVGLDPRYPAHRDLVIRFRRDLQGAVNFLLGHGLDVRQTLANTWSSAATMPPTASCTFDGAMIVMGKRSRPARMLG